MVEEGSEEKGDGSMGVWNGDDVAQVPQVGSLKIIFHLLIKNMIFFSPNREKVSSLGASGGMVII